MKYRVNVEIAMEIKGIIVEADSEKAAEEEAIDLCSKFPYSIGYCDGFEKIEATEIETCGDRETAKEQLEFDRIQEVNAKQHRHEQIEAYQNVLKQAATSISYIEQMLPCLGIGK
jgi:hypothetical protein